MNSFISWIGGKKLLRDDILARLPPEYYKYIEVFGGGASVLFTSDKYAPIEVYNDANGQLVNLFRCLKYHREELQKEIRYYLNSREMFQDCRSRLESSGTTDIQRAAMYYVCIKTSFGADTDSFGCAPKSLDTGRFEDIEKRLDRVLIDHKDFEELMNQFDRTNALFYCDPPYHTTEKHYSERFAEADHYRLNAVLKALKGRFILSYNDDDFVRELYKDFDIKTVERQNNLSKGSFKEVIIKNF